MQLFKEEFGTTYTYDGEGNVKSVVDLQNEKTDYEYDTNNNLTAIIQDGKNKMTYTYYENSHNVKTATTEEGYVYTFTYDDYGNNTSVSIKEKTSNAVKQTISTSATYTADGNYMATATDALGNVTEYGYNLQTGLLEWVKKDRGRFSVLVQRQGTVLCLEWQSTNGGKGHKTGDGSLS